MRTLYKDFLKAFDFEALFCQYAACIPDFPWPPTFSPNFDIPALPKLPSFDPLGFLNMQIELSLIDLIVGFLCGLIRGILDLLKKAITISLYFLCLGIVVQLLIDDKILGWDPVGNIQDAGGSFIGVIALVAMYALFIQKKT